MQLGLRHFGETSLTWFKEKSRDPSATRWSLARGICEREDWRNRQGEWCIASACKALPQLAAHLGVTLPAARPVASVRAPASDYPDLALDCALEELGEVSVRRVAAKDVGAFRRLLHTHHPLGWDRSPGAALNCWIVSSRQGRLVVRFIKRFAFHAMPKSKLRQRSCTGFSFISAMPLRMRDFSSAADATRM